MTENRRTVLVVDDQSNWRDVMVALLKDDFAVFQASSHNAALKAILEQDPPFHVVVTDIRLVDEETANEGGLTLLEQLNKMGTETQTIVITGYPTIETARTALGQLQAFDYILKVPEHGKFSPAEFRRTVQQAAEKAERQRPRAFVRSDWHILVIENNEARRKKLVDILVSDGYRVDELQDTTDLDQQLKNQDKPYNLMIVNEMYMGKEAALASTVRRYHPECRIIILTEQNIGDILRPIQEGSALSALTIRDDVFDPWVFRETVQRAFAPDAIKYAVASFEGVMEEQSLRIGVSYTLSIRLQDSREVGASAIWLAPPVGKRNRIQLKVFIHAPQMSLRPDSESYWEIPHQGRQRPFCVEVTPQAEQKAIIMIDLEQDNRWLGRIEKEVIVNNMGPV
jgi:ActR/RegA family two-component response regulator